MKRGTKSTSSLALSVLVFGLTLSVIGLLAIYDASVVEAFKDFEDKYHFVKQQTVWILIGTILALIVSRVPIEIIKKYAHIFLGIGVFLLCAVLVPGLGTKLLGARRWFIFGPVVIQPSELIKIILIVYLSKWLEYPRELKHFLAMLGVILGLIMLQPDLGTGIVVVGVCFAMYYLSGTDLKKLSLFTVVLFGVMSLLVIASPYRFNRLKTFMDPTTDPLGTSYHINQILNGLGSGGLFGVGVGQSRQKYAYLPEATTDSIFVIIAEEFGLVGSLVLMGVLLGLVLFALKISLKSSDKFDKLLAGGVSLLFFTQIFVNLSAMTALMPLTGVPLPFISYGGSSLVTNFIALGLLMNVAKRV